MLPPGYLCCGYPQTAAGEADRGQRIITDNRVLFHRVANTLNYLDIKTVIVSCGTCMDQLAEIRVRARSSRAAGCSTSTSTCSRRASSSQGIEGVRYMYHDPCHTPMKTYAPLEVVNELMGAPVR